MRSSETDPPRRSIVPCSALTGFSVGIRPSTTLTAPPIASEPKRSVAGPRRISICSACAGSKVTAWSTLTTEASPVSSPFSMTRTRPPVRPRMIGRPAPGTNAVEYTPGSFSSVSPRVAPRRSWRSLPDSTETGFASSEARRISPVAVTTTSSKCVPWRSSSWSSASSPPVTVTEPFAVPKAGISTTTR